MVTPDNKACLLGCGMLLPNNDALLEHSCQRGQASNQRQSSYQVYQQPPLLPSNNKHESVTWQGNSNGACRHLRPEIKVDCSLLDGELFGVNKGPGLRLKVLMGFLSKKAQF
jgi:hypothetical protein